MSEILKHISREALRFSMLAIVFFLLVIVLQAAPKETSSGSKSQKVGASQESPSEPAGGAQASKLSGDDTDDPDMPPGVSGKIDPETYLRLRAEYIARIRGIDPNNPPDPQLRVNAIRMMEEQQAARALGQAGGAGPLTSGTWTELGPQPIPNGQTSPSVAVSGRVTAIAVHPTNPNTVYVGTAQGGAYRSLDGGATWTHLMDGAASLAVGAIAIAPSQPSTIYVGTGEANFSLDSFFGVGVYRIDSADTTPVLVGPLSKDGGGNDIFKGRAISQILVHPTDPNTIFVSTTSGASGLDGGGFVGAPLRGVYRSSNAAGPAGSVTFTKLTVGSVSADRSITDMAMEPGNPNNIVVALFGNAGDGGYYRTTNALAATPTFTQTLILLAQTMRLSINNVSSTVTVLAGSGDNGTSGVLRRSVDGGQTWSVVPGGNGYCDGQCFYDAPVALKPDDANTFFLGGSAGSLMLRKTINGGTSFTTPNASLHADTHAIVYAPSDFTVMYEGNDGGIWRSADGGNTWTSRNTAGFAATQFQSLALHPSDRNFMIGGTQDNGTPMMRADGSWFRADFGDGGYSLIDQNAPDATNVTMYHTYFNSTSARLIGYAHVTGVANAFDGNWTFSGCNGAPANGITCTDAVLFYAPMTRGPGTPNTIYYGSDHLYRSADGGSNNVVVSQNPIVASVPISTIGVSPQNDNVRIVGLRNGKVFATTTGSTTLTDVTGPIPPRYIARAVIDPNNSNTAYVTLDDYGLAPGQHVWKTINLNGAPPTWTASGTGIPDVPVNSMAIDPADSTSLYAATDIGVYHSGDSGATWSPFGTGLPVVACFDIGIQSANRVLRVATHGRGIWETSLGALPTTTTVISSQNPSVFGQSVTFTATVSGLGTPTGTVQFKDSGITIGSGTLSGGIASFATSALNVGVHNITAVYGGDSTFNGSTSSVLMQTVNQAATTTAVGSSANPSTFPNPVTFTATVTINAPGSGTPTGSVIFMDGATVLGSSFLSSGTAMLSTNALAITPPATHSITAVYNGDTNFAGSTSSPPLVQVVNGTASGSADIGVTVTHAPNNPNGVVAIGAPLTFTITVTNHDTTATPDVALNLSSVGGPAEVDNGVVPAGWTCTGGSNSIQCSRTAMPANSSAVFTLPTRPLFSDARTFTGIAAITSSAATDPDPTNDYVADTVNPRPRPRGIRK